MAAQELAANRLTLDAATAARKVALKQRPALPIPQTAIGMLPPAHHLVEPLPLRVRQSCQSAGRM